MQLVKDPVKNKRLVLIVGILTIANLSIMATFPKLKLTANKNIHAKHHFKQAHQLVKQKLIPSVNALSSDYQLYNYDNPQQQCCFSGTLRMKNSNTTLTFKVFPKKNEIHILDSKTKKYISLTTWLDQNK